jgi:hypothetical protein
VADRRAVPETTDVTPSLCESLRYALGGKYTRRMIRRKREQERATPEDTHPVYIPASQPDGSVLPVEEHRRRNEAANRGGDRMNTWADVG